VIAYQAKLVDIYGEKLKHLHSDKKKTSELLIRLRFSMEDCRGAAKEAQESYDTTGTQLRSITGECVVLQNQIRVLFHCLSLLEIVQEFVLHFSDGFNFYRSLLDLR
jgi:hypothetical protein